MEAPHSSWGRLCLSNLSFLIRIYKLLVCVCMCVSVCVRARLKVCRHRHNLKPTKASHLHLLWQHRAAIIVISKAATAFPAFVMAAVELAIGGGRGEEVCCGRVQTCAGSFPLLLFLPTYAAFFTVCQQFQGFQRHSRRHRHRQHHHRHRQRHYYQQQQQCVCVCGAYIVDINGTNRRPASLHKRKCRVVSVSLALGERGSESKQATGYISDRRTNDHNCNG